MCPEWRSVFDLCQRKESVLQSNLYLSGSHNESVSLRIPSYPPCGSKGYSLAEKRHAEIKGGVLRPMWRRRQSVVDVTSPPLHSPSPRPGCPRLPSVVS